MVIEPVRSDDSSAFGFLGVGDTVDSGAGTGFELDWIEGCRLRSCGVLSPVAAAAVAAASSLEKLTCTVAIFSSLPTPISRLLWLELERMEGLRSMELLCVYAYVIESLREGIGSVWMTCRVQLGVAVSDADVPGVEGVGGQRTQQRGRAVERAHAGWVQLHPRDPGLEILDRHEGAVELHCG